MTFGRLATIVVAGLLVGGTVCGQEAAAADAGAAVVTNTTTPPTPPTLFVAVQPCRLADTRGNGFTGPFGPPALAALTPRVIPVAGNCGIPSDAQAVSANLTVTQPVAAGWVSIWPEGGAQPSPLVASITYAQAQTLSNAVVARLGTGGGITLYSKVGTHVVIDVNGYYRRPGPSMTTSCKLVGNVYWCLNPDACGQACNDLCTSLGLEVLADPAVWFAAQDTLSECQAISNAFGLGSTVMLAGWTYGCLEDEWGAHTAPGGLVGPLYCSTESLCPSEHLTQMDGLGTPCSDVSRRSICPCQ